MYCRTSSLLVVILALCLVSGLKVHLKLNSKLKLPTTKKIHTLQQETEVLAARDASNIKPCFDYYSPLFDGITNQFEKDYYQCLQIFDNHSGQAASKWNYTLLDIQQREKAGCNTFFECDSIVDYVAAFECFARVGAEQSKTLYSVSAYANEAATQSKLTLQELETELDNCENSAERDYVEGTANTYEQLNGCLSSASAPLPQQKTTEDPWYRSTAPEYYTRSN
ncbi:hypothetical protein KR009_006231 [Drosophila setifemur]|nr:hypothetical protein KR009_006231 [Drosophila setifemur]